MYFATFQILQILITKTSEVPFLLHVISSLYKYQFSTKMEISSTVNSFRALQNHFCVGFFKSLIRVLKNGLHFVHKFCRCAQMWYQFWVMKRNKEQENATLHHKSDKTATYCVAWQSFYWSWQPFLFVLKWERYVRLVEVWHVLSFKNEKCFRSVNYCKKRGFVQFFILKR